MSETVKRMEDGGSDSGSLPRAGAVGSGLYAIQQAIDYIEERLEETLELQEIADRAYMSVPNLYRSFHALTGHPIKEYVRKRRISTAAAHLRHSPLPVVDVAIGCGFESYQAFVKSFKKLVGMTPGDYRHADVHYSFEPADLLSRVSYREDRELSERYPGVKVIRRLSRPALIFLHAAESPEGIEAEAFRAVYGRLEALGWNMARIRLFGRNVELPSRERPSGYELMVPLPGGIPDASGAGDLRLGTLPGGLYAVCAAEERGAQAAWDRLLAEWLPRSAFVLGGHELFEEFLTYRGAVTRMKLYLPVERRERPDTIEIVAKERTEGFAAAAEGPAAREEADGRMIGWLERNGMAGHPGVRLFMSHTYGMPLNEGGRYELIVSVPSEWRRACATGPLEPVVLEGGLYACLASGAHGLMTGVLERMHRWLLANAEYTYDDSRKWYAEYTLGEGVDIDRAAVVRCFLPVIGREAE